MDKRKIPKKKQKQNKKPPNDFIVKHDEITDKIKVSKGSATSI